MPSCYVPKPSGFGSIRISVLRISGKLEILFHGHGSSKKKILRLSDQVIASILAGKVVFLRLLPVLAFL
jgi:hypothetical protein